MKKGSATASESCPGDPRLGRGLGVNGWPAAGGRWKGTLRVPGPLGTLLKIGVSVGLVFIVVGGNFHDLIASLAPARSELLVLAAATHGISLALTAARWRLLMRVQAVVLSFRETLLIYWVGCFFNLCLPTSVGGDVVKGYLVARRNGRAVEVFTTVVMERVVGFLALVAVAAAGAFWVLLGAGGDGRWSTLALALGVVVGSGDGRHRWTGRARERLARFWLAVRRYGKHEPELLLVFALSLLHQINVVGCYIIVARALDIDVPLAYFCLLVPAVLVSTMLPVSVGGLGVREVAFVAFFSPLGVPASELIALSLWSYALMLLVALSGGVVYSLSRLGAPRSSAGGPLSVDARADDGR